MTEPKTYWEQRCALAEIALTNLVKILHENASPKLQSDLVWFANTWQEQMDAIQPEDPKCGTHGN